MNNYSQRQNYVQYEQIKDFFEWLRFVCPFLHAQHDWWIQIKIACIMALIPIAIFVLFNEWISGRKETIESDFITFSLKDRKMH